MNTNRNIKFFCVIVKFIFNLSSQLKFHTLELNYFVFYFWLVYILILWVFCYLILTSYFFAQSTGQRGCRSSSVFSYSFRRGNKCSKREIESQWPAVEEISGGESISILSLKHHLNLCYSTLFWILDFHKLKGFYNLPTDNLATLRSLNQPCGCCFMKPKP